MASYLQMPSGRWRVTVSVGKKRKTRTFRTKLEARRWSEQVAEKLHAQTESGIEAPLNATIGDILRRYDRDVVPRKRGARREHNFIQVLLRDPLADVALEAPPSPAHFADWRDRRLRQVCANSVRREFAILGDACEIARREWRWIKTNPVRDVRKPKPGKARTRRPTEEETRGLIEAMNYDDTLTIPPRQTQQRVALAYLFAIETAMRAGEICGITPRQIHERYVHLPETKNEDARDVPLSSRAQAILQLIRETFPDLRDDEPVFQVKPGSLDTIFRKAKRKTGIEDLHFHDTRREGLTRLSKRFSVMELAKVSGHRDIRILQNVYYQPDIGDLADKLD